MKKWIRECYQIVADYREGRVSRDGALKEIANRVGSYCTAELWLK